MWRRWQRKAKAFFSWARSDKRKKRLPKRLIAAEGHERRRPDGAVFEKRRRAARPRTEAPPTEFFRRRKYGHTSGRDVRDRFERGSDCCARGAPDGHSGGGDRGHELRSRSRQLGDSGKRRCVGRASAVLY